MQKAQYNFRVSIDKETNIRWLEGIMGKYSDVWYDLYQEQGYCHVVLHVEEPSDFYIAMHNAYRQGIVKEYRVYSENTEK